MTIRDTAPEAPARMHWITADRLRVYPRIVLAVYLALAAFWIAGSEDLLDPGGKPIGADFIAFWSASSLTLSGTPVEVFDQDRMLEAGRAAVPSTTAIFPWFYPPQFQLAILPLAILPYIPAYLLWVVTTFAAFALVIRRIAPVPQTLWFLVAFPGTFINALHGQNGFLTGALLGGAILLLERRPLWAGVLIGLLSYKPHFGILIPLALLLGCHWRAFLAATGATLCFAAISTAVVGIDYWAAFFENLPLLREALERGLLPWSKMPTVFAGLRILGVGAEVAYLAQVSLGLGVAVMVALIWWRRTPIPLAGAALVSGSLLVSPYLYDYDLALLAVPIALVAWDGYRRGWAAGEREILILAWVTPLFVLGFTDQVGFSPAPLCLILVFAMIARRGLRAGPSPDTESRDVKKGLGRNDLTPSF